LEGMELAQKAVDAACDKQASNIVLLDVRGACSFADYFVICSGETERQLNALADEIGYRLKKEGVLPHHREGTVESGWLLLDFGNVIVHVFSAAARDYYQLDQLWSQAVPVVRIQ